MQVVKVLNFSAEPYRKQKTYTVNIYIYILKTKETEDKINHNPSTIQNVLFLKRLMGHKHTCGT